MIEDYANQLSEFKIKIKSNFANHDINCSEYDFSDHSVMGNDLVLRINDEIIASLDLKFRRFNNEIPSLDSELYIRGKINIASVLKIRYVVLTDGKSYLVHDTFKIFKSDSLLNFDNFINLLKTPIKKQINETKKAIISCFKKNIEAFNILSLKNLKLPTIKEIGYEKTNHFFYFDKKKVNDETNMDYENYFFNEIIETVFPETELYRYTSLESCFQSLKNTNYRMNCIVGMNDTTEIDYTENYIFGQKLDYLKASWITIETINRRFILSFSLKKDDLTQWRFYADDCRGVCLIFKVKDNFQSERFILKKISYADDDKSHPKLDLIKSILSEFKSTLNIDFRLREFHIWKHFFKPFDYKIEQEVRLLYITNPIQDSTIDWYITDKNSIINPFITIDFDNPNFPLTLTEIIVGSNCSEKEINLRQLEQLLRFNKIKKIDKINLIDMMNNDIDIKVLPSKINNFR